EVRGERTFSDVPVYAPEGMTAAPARVSVVLQGPQRLVQSTLPSAIRAVVPRDSLPAEIPAAGVDAPLVVGPLSPGVTARPQRVRVTPAGVAPPADSQPAAPGRP
ncbi:MAG TPA: hypothetical protein VFY65_04585, partial [Longimicrobium sp.]|nr:hypothetical protein [Longimicrobium sp.]